MRQRDSAPVEYIVACYMYSNLGLLVMSCRTRILLLIEVKIARETQSTNTVKATIECGMSQYEKLSIKVLFLKAHPASNYTRHYESAIHNVFTSTCIVCKRRDKRDNDTTRPVSILLRLRLSPALRVYVTVNPINLRQKDRAAAPAFVVKFAEHCSREYLSPLLAQRAASVSH